MIVLELKTKDGTPINLEGLQCNVFYKHENVERPIGIGCEIIKNIIHLDDVSLSYGHEGILKHEGVLRILNGADK